MIGAAAALGAVIAAGGATYGGIKSGQKNREAMNLINQTQKDRKAWHELYQSQDWTMRADAQNRINQASKTLEEWNKRIKKTNTVAGGTDEAVALQKEAANKAYADVMANEGALASEAKDREAHQYVADNANINLQKAQMNQQQAAQIAQAASQVVNAGVGLMGTGIHYGGGSGSTSVSTMAATPESKFNASMAATNQKTHDLTATGNAQLGITDAGLPKAQDVTNFPVPPSQRKTGA